MNQLCQENLVAQVAPIYIHSIDNGHTKIHSTMDEIRRGADVVWCGTCIAQVQQCMVRYGMVWYGMVWHCMVWHCMVWYDKAWYDKAWYGTVQYAMVQYGMVWYIMLWQGVVCYCGCMEMKLPSFNVPTTKRIPDNRVFLYKQDKGQSSRRYLCFSSIKYLKRQQLEICQ